MAQALAELEHYAYLEQMELSPLKELIAGYAKLGNWAKVKTYGEMATFINPQDNDVLLALGRAKAFVAMGKVADAKAALAIAMKTEPENAEVLELKGKLK